MSQTRQEMEPKDAASQAFIALMEAGRYSGYGLSTLGARMGRRAVVAGAEGARRTGGAWSALRGTTPPEPRSNGRIVVLAVVAGGAAALTVRRGVVALRGSDSEFGRRLRGVLPGRQSADTSSGAESSTGAESSARETESRSDAHSSSAGGQA